MAEKKQTGLFWGSNVLFLVESVKLAPQTMFRIDFEAPSPDATNDKKGALESWEKELSLKIKQTIHDKKLQSSTVNLSLPTKDIIFRSFTIPNMQPHEIHRAVGFEVGKYIPFPLDNLNYAYHSSPFTRNGKKLINVIFVAIKITALDFYLKILKAASLRTNVIEPAASSMIRTLSSRELLPQEETVALIEKSDIGRIIIINNNIPHFVREFHLGDPPSDENSQDQDLENAVKILTKEVRISLDYFNRQHDQLKVAKIFLLASADEKNLPENLQKYLGIPVEPVLEKSVLGQGPEQGSGILNAYGASIISTMDKPPIFDFSSKKSGAAKAKKQIVFKKFSLKASLHWVVASVVIIVLAIGFVTYKRQSIKSEILLLKNELGSYQDSNVSFIQKKDSALKDKLGLLEKLRTDSNVAEYLQILPGLLPEEAWLGNLKITYNDPDLDNKPDKNKKSLKSSKTENDRSTVTMILDGYIYTEDPNQQFPIFNKLLMKVRENETFAKTFQKFEPDSNAKIIEKYSVTNFKITCRQTNEP